MLSTQCRRLWGRTLGWALVVGAIVAATAFGQEEPAAGRDLIATPSAKENPQNVTVNDSPEARKDIETARNLEQQKEWVKAAGWYQQVLEKYRTRVVPWKANNDNVINRYRGIVYQVQQSLAKWPPEGIDAYRRQYESVAAALLAKTRADDSDALSSILETYFVTESAKTAGIKLIDLHMEAGDFDAAAQVGELLLDWYPQQHLLVERPGILFRTALAHHLCHDDDAATRLAAELKQKFPDATGTMFGKDIVLSTALAKLLTTSAILGQSGAPDSWVMFGGSPDRAHISSSLGHIGARIFSIDLLQNPTLRPPVVGQDRENPADTSVQSDEERGLLLGIMPVVDDGELFFQDGRRLWARELDSGIPLPEWAETYAGDEDLKGVYQLKNASQGRGGQYTLTLTDNSVLAVMGQSTRAIGVVDGFAPRPMSPTRLVCLDRKTGRERWTVSLGFIEGDGLKDEEKQRLQSLDLSGSPLVIGNKVFVIARGGKDPQFENCYVLCFDLSSGHYRWSCLVASAGSSQNVYMQANAETGSSGSTVSHLAYAGGRLYVMTNLGAVAAIDAHDGSVVWLSLYNREGSDPADASGFRFVGGRMRGFGGSMTNERPWEFNAVVAHEGRLFVLPVDSRFLMVYDAATGQQLKAIDMSQFQDTLRGDASGYDRPRALIGLVGDQLIMTGRQTVYALKWSTYDPQRQMTDNAPANIVFTALRMDDGQQEIRGRAILVAASVVVTTNRKLYRLDLVHDLKIAEVYPTGGQQEWDESEGPGNVIATADHVIIAGSKSVNVYTDMALARAKLDKEVADSPQDPQPRLHYGEVMFAAGQAQLALEKLDEAVVLLGGAGQMRPGPDRQRVFNDALNFSKRLANDKRGESNEEALKFFDLAASAADAPMEQVSYRLRRARFARDNVDPDSYATAVRLYQDILDHPDWRLQAVHRDDNASEPSSGGNLDIQAGDLAEHEIHDILLRHPDAYAAEEQLAVAALEKAQQADGPAQLLAVADKYPNAAVASKAMLQASQAYEKAGRPRQATHLLRQIYRKYGNTADKGLILEAMVRNYLTLPGGLELAKARLQHAKNFADTRLTGSLKLPDGTVIENVTFKEALAQMEKVRLPQSVAAEIDLHIPQFKQNGDGSWPHAFSPDDVRAISIPQITSLVLPPDSVDNALMRGDRIVAIQNFEHLAIFAPGEPKPLGTTDALTAAPRFGMWISPPPPAATQPSTTAPSQVATLLVWNGTEIAMLDGSTAQPIWKSPLNSLPACEVVNAAGLAGVQVTTDTLPGGAAIRQEMVPMIDNRTGRRIFVPNGFRQIAVAGGQIQNEAPRQTGPEQICQLQPIGDRVIAGTTSGRMMCISMADGKLIWQMRVNSKPIDKLVANEDFSAVTVNDDGTVRLIVLDNFNGQVQTIRNFAADQGMVPQNLALSADGTLVWTLPDRLCGQDLYEPGNQLRFEFPSAPQGAQTNVIIRGGAAFGGGVIQAGNAAIYLGCTKPGQLIIRDNRILAIEQSGRFLVAHSLEDGSVLNHRDEHGTSIPTELSTNISTSTPQQQRDLQEVNVSLRVAGHYVYVLSPRNLIAYNMDDPATDQWRTDTMSINTNPNYKAAWPVRDFLLVLGEPPGDQAAGNDVGAPLCQLRVFDRRQIVDPNGGGSTEGGKLEYNQPVKDMSGITQLQPVNGGVYWLGGDHTLHFLPGSRHDQ
jgi:outer membrane protein assembly factor BamB